jgi:Ni2+-binding GTPase involved in maturation of urease and hydrogenase
MSAPREVLVTVSGPVGSGKSAICGEIEIALKAIGVPVAWNDEGERAMNVAWDSSPQNALELYQPRVTIVETNEHIERKRICAAAEKANHDYGQWMPQGWLDHFMTRFFGGRP